MQLSDRHFIRSAISVLSHFPIAFQLKVDITDVSKYLVLLVAENTSDAGNLLLCATCVKGNSEKLGPHSTASPRFPV